MKKDIGSIFPLYDKDLKPFHEMRRSLLPDDTINFSLCREALQAVALKYEYSRKTILLPAYTCSTVIEPFKRNGWECHYYNVSKELRLDLPELMRLNEKVRPTFILVHPYLGMEFNQEEISTLRLIKQTGCKLIEDLTQCLFTERRHEIFDFFVGSYRKWGPIPDGAFLQSFTEELPPPPQKTNNVFVTKQTDAMYLRGCYFLTNDPFIKDISIRMNKSANKDISEDTELHRMSELSEWIWNSEDKGTIVDKRLDNYKYLFDNIKETEYLELVCKKIDKITTAPLYFPIYTKERGLLQKTLAENQIYAPILWPVHSEEVLINDNIRYIYDTILMLPIDQRYDEEDMARIATIINNFHKK